MDDEARDVFAYLALGANLGDRMEYIRAAVAALASLDGIEFDPDRDAASIYESSPAGGPPGQAMFLNTVIQVRTSLSPRELLNVCLRIEQSLGRERHERNGPRVIDIDILFFGEEVRAEAGLTLPHPRLHERRFVLAPLAELAPEMVHAKLGGRISEWLGRTPASDGDGPSVVRVAGRGWFSRSVRADYRASGRAPMRR